VEARLDLAASNYSGGEVEEFETVSEQVTAELAYLVQAERFRAKVGDQDEPASVALRVTSVFRLEEGVWKLAHRHADPISDFRPAESVIEARSEAGLGMSGRTPMSFVRR
jgi:ketosteroid isomerase-like protein